MFWIPWLEPIPVGLTFELGHRILEMPRFRIGDARTVTRRDKLANDLVMYQPGRPRPQSYKMEFGPYLKEKGAADAPPEWLFTEFKKLMRMYPGWIATITLPDGTLLMGIVNEPVYSEGGTCQMMINFTFDILRDFPQGEVPV